MPGPHPTSRSVPLPSRPSSSARRASSPANRRAYRSGSGQPRRRKSQGRIAPSDSRASPTTALRHGDAKRGRTRHHVDHGSQVTAVIIFLPYEGRHPETEEAFRSAIPCQVRARTCARICARDSCERADGMGRSKSQIQDAGRSPRQAGSPETRRDTRNVSHSSHDPEVAGSNPGPAPWSSPARKEDV